MDSPLGLTYTPSFPSMQSLFTQMRQVRALRQKQIQEENKTTETRAFQAVADFHKFHPDRPYVKALEPYFQTQAQESFALLQGVKNRTTDPGALYEHMGKMQSDADKAKRYDTETGTFMKKWKESGNFNDDVILNKYANHTVNLQVTDDLKTTTMLPPDAVDPNRFVNTVITDPASYNQRALSEKFIANLKSTEEQENVQYDPAGQVVTKTKSLPSRYFGGLGESGQNVLKLGDVGSDQSKVLLNRFRAMGPDWDNYLQLRTAKENEGFDKMSSDERGVAMQKTLQNVMVENGYIGQKQTETFNRAPSDADKMGTKRDATKIGFSQKSEDEATAAADVLDRLMKGDKAALGYFKGPNVETARVENGELVIKMKQGKVDQLAQIMSVMAQSNPDMKGFSLDASTGEGRIKLTPENVVELVNYKNAVGSRADWIGEHVEQAYNKKYSKREKVDY